MAEVFSQSDCYYTGFIGAYHVRLPHRPDFWLWAANGAPDDDEKFYRYKWIVRMLWRTYSPAQDFFLQQFRDSTEVTPWGF